MPDKVSTLETILRPPPHRREEADAELPDLHAGEYQAYARPANKPIHSIHFINTKGEIRSFQYVHLDSDSRYFPEKIVLRFLGAEPVGITIRGRNLWRLYDYIHQHRTAWVAESPRDFAVDCQPCVTNVCFESEPV